jgi:hypothetical protein
VGSRRLAGGMHLPSHYLLEDKVMEEKLKGIPRIGTLVSVVYFHNLRKVAEEDTSE